MQLLLGNALRVPGGEGSPPDDLHSHMEDRFAWAVARGHAVAVLVCEPSGLERAERATPGATPGLLRTLAHGLEAPFAPAEAVVDLERDSGRMLVLLVGPDPKGLESACRAWAAGARPLRLGLRVGYAVTQPGKRLFLDTLLAVARAGLDVARCRAPGACVHTMLYDILQERLEGERGAEGLVVGAALPLAPGTPPAKPAPAPAPLARDVPAAEARPAPPRSDASSATTPEPARVPVLSELERRQRELTLALEAQRRENEALRARLQELERPEGAPVPAPTFVPVSEEPADRQRIDLLERRLAKLVRSLEEAEERVARVSSANEPDTGISSRFKTVQGLDPDDPRRGLKATLMQEIFQANLELRERVRALSDAKPFGAARRKRGGSEGLASA